MLLEENNEKRKVAFYPADDSTVVTPQPPYPFKERVSDIIQRIRGITFVEWAGAFSPAIQFGVMFMKKDNRDIFWEFLNWIIGFIFLGTLVFLWWNGNLGMQNGRLRRR